MEMFSEKFGSQITAASFMRFTLYLKDHYTGWSEKVKAYETREFEMWITAVKTAKEREEIRADESALLLADTLYHLYLGLPYRGALVDKPSLLLI